MKTLMSIICFLSFCYSTFSQEETCSKLGAWVWHLEVSGFPNHQQLADSLVSLGVKRVLIKVADGSLNENSWPEVADVNLVNIYKTRGIETYAWSYNYPGNYKAQADALYRAGETGYEGFVVDVEIEFNGDSQALNGLFSAFKDAKDSLLNDELIDENFNLYCTTWGNPQDHNMYISVIDPYVDGYMAQTYVEQWGESYVEDLEYWIAAGNEEYIEMGATKPVHHIIAMQDGDVSVERANAFLQTAGPESSIWRVPGGSIDESVWNTWNEIDWDFNFCPPTNSTISKDAFINIYPNPTNQFITVQNEFSETIEIELYNNIGRLILEKQIEKMEVLDLSNLESGIYFIKIKASNYQCTKSIIKVSE